MASYFWSRIFDLVFLKIYMLFKMRDFLRKITKHDILGNKERGFPRDFNQSELYLVCNFLIFFLIKVQI